MCFCRANSKWVPGAGCREGLVQAPPVECGCRNLAKPSADAPLDIALEGSCRLLLLECGRFGNSAAIPLPGGKNSAAGPACIWLVRD